MTLTHLAWLLVLVVLPLVLLGLVLRKRRVVVEKIETLERSEEHEALFQALSRWLQDERIARACIENYVATRVGIAQMFAALPAYDEAKTKAVAACLLRDRTVRRVIAGFEQRDGTPRRQVMEALAEWSRFPEGQEAQSA